MDFFARRCETRCFFFQDKFLVFLFLSLRRRQKSASKGAILRVLPLKHTNMVGVLSIRSSTLPHRSRNVRLDASRAPFRFRRGSRAFARTSASGVVRRTLCASLCDKKIKLLENGFYGGRILGEEGSRCHFERLLCIEEYFVNAHRTSVASRYLREGRVFPRGDLTFFLR